MTVVEGHVDSAPSSLPKRPGRSHEPRRVRTSPLRAVGTLMSVLVGVVYLMPLLVILSLSVRSTTDVFSGSLIPREFRLGNYSTAWSNFQLGTLFMHSIVVTVGSTILTLIFALTAAYGFARNESRTLQIAYYILLGGLMAPPAVIVVPFFLGMKQLGLYNSLSGVIIGETVFALPLAVLLLRGYVENVPGELVDSARIDGASELKVFWYVVLPLLRPAIATVTLFTVLSTWNDFLIPLVLLADTSSSTVTVGMSQFTGQFGSLGWQFISAAAIMAMAPLLILFVASRRYYVRGLTAGALKQ